MVTAFVLITVRRDMVPQTAEALTNLDGVAEVYSVSGEYDIFAILRVKEYDSLAKVASEWIAGIPGITTTNTHMAFRCYSKHDMEKMWEGFITQ